MKKLILLVTTVTMLGLIGCDGKDMLTDLTTKVTDEAKSAVKEMAQQDNTETTDNHTDDIVNASDLDINTTEGQ
jgi:hypothetical protein